MINLSVDKKIIVKFVSTDLTMTAVFANLDTLNEYINNPKEFRPIIGKFQLNCFEKEVEFAITTPEGKIKGTATKVPHYYNYKV